MNVAMVTKRFVEQPSCFTSASCLKHPKSGAFMKKKLPSLTLQKDLFLPTLWSTHRATGLAGNPSCSIKILQMERFPLDDCNHHFGQETGWPPSSGGGSSTAQANL